MCARSTSGWRCSPVPQIVTWVIRSIRRRLTRSPHNLSTQIPHQATIRGPADTPFEGGRFQIRIEIGPEYPIRPPLMRFVTRVFHPNIHFEVGGMRRPNYASVRQAQVKLMPRSVSVSQQSHRTFTPTPPDTDGRDLPGHPEEGVVPRVEPAGRLPRRHGPALGTRRRQPLELRCGKHGAGRRSAGLCQRRAHVHGGVRDGIVASARSRAVGLCVHRLIGWELAAFVGYLWIIKKKQDTTKSK